MTLVLVAEDVPVISLSLEDALTDGGDTAVAVSSNVAALAWLDDRTPDLAMLDLILSDGSTVELARVLRDRGVPTLSSVDIGALCPAIWMMSSGSRSRSHSGN